MAGKIRVIDDDGESLQFQLLDGENSGEYTFWRDPRKDCIHSIYRENKAVPTETTQYILAALRFAGLTDGKI